MNHYPHHIGDFNNATRHLTRIERSIYRDLMDLYYDTEQPLTLDVKALCRRVLAHSDEEATAVQQVLNEFFTETATGWYHSRCETVLQDYRDNISAKSAAGKASAAKREAERLEKLNGGSSDVQQVLNSVDSSVQLTVNQKPETTNQEPETIKDLAPDGDLASPKFSALRYLTSKGVDSQVAKDWLATRKAKKLAPTITAIDQVLEHIAEAGITASEGIKICAIRGWAGFNGKWLENENQARGSAPAQTNLKAAQEAANAEAKRRLFGNNDDRVIDA